MGGWQGPELSGLGDEGLAKETTTMTKFSLPRRLALSCRNVNKHKTESIVSVLHLAGGREEGREGGHEEGTEGQGRWGGVTLHPSPTQRKVI